MTLPNVPNYDKRFEAILFIRGADGHTDEEVLNIIEVDENMIQLADSTSPIMSLHRLLFGDLFRVSKLAAGQYEILEPVLPSQMQHYFFLAESPPAAYTSVLHELGGEWECEAGLMFCLHVPRVRTEELYERAGGFDLSSKEEIFSGEN